MRTYVTTGVIGLLAGAALAHLVSHPHAAAAGAFAPSPPHFARSFTVSHFVRGNLHTHTNRSDGDSTPEDVIRWYQAHGYGFLALTDHNRLSIPSDYASLVTPDFTLVPGEEVSMYVHGRQVHVNALCTRTVILGGDFTTSAEALDHALREISAQQGVAIVNHPNFDWALTKNDVVGAEGETFLEVASGHPYVHTAGDKTHPSHEQLWDDALTAGRDVMGVAVDDVHHLVTDADPEAFPGVAWVELFGDAHGVDAVCDALRQGALYASTGAALRSITVTRDAYEVVPEDHGATVVFFGSGGRTLAPVAAGNGENTGATYRVVGDEGYVRARVEGTHGFAWTPAVRVTRER
jgi:hypothetical protein